MSRDHIWIIEARILPSKEWNNILTFNNKPATFFTREDAREAAKRFEAQNRYNHPERVVLYRPVKYVEAKGA